MGIFLPVAETIRRSSQILNYKEFFSWFDDYMLGFVLLWSASLVLKGKTNAIAYLIAAWGIGVGALVLSFLGQFKTSETSGFSTVFVATIKGLILVYMFIGLYKAIQANLTEKIKWN